MWRRAGRPQLNSNRLGSAITGDLHTIANVILKRFEAPDEVRRFPRGMFEFVTIGGVTVGRATYEPSFRWSVDLSPSVGTPRCYLEHVGVVLQGRAIVAFDDERVWELGPGTLFHIPGEPHDIWVVGNEPFVSLHFAGEGYFSK